MTYSNVCRLPFALPKFQASSIHEKKKKQERDKARTAPKRVSIAAFRCEGETRGRGSNRMKQIEEGERNRNVLANSALALQKGVVNR